MTDQPSNEISPNDAEVRRTADPRTVLLDVREAAEWREAHIPGAVLLPLDDLAATIATLVPDRQTPIICQCGAGVRSKRAAATLVALGYTNVASMRGGLRAWRAAGLPCDSATDFPFTPDEQQRYERHLRIPEVGVAGQVKLRAARVLLIGAGGLGSPAALYLAAAGVGTLGIVDDDVVDLSNLQRQILHQTASIGRRKVDSACETLHGINPLVRVEPYAERLTTANIERLFAPYDLILDGSDNFPTRYLINDACVLLQKPLVHGSVHRFTGQASVFWPGRGPCYRCLYPTPPPPDLAPSCAEAGVLGILPGVIGLLQAVEAIKLILQQGDLLLGRLLCYDALRAEFHELRLGRDPACTHCAPHRPFPGFTDYDGFCRGR
ncbi:MAG: molybdopterin-synthase adenylyltransferase MoeB [Deltaproteobacteria bacterium]|nr:molybdopterin-synthase adenylyltransferase MoeB [Deltaproteobacteria bacterium]